MWQYTSMPDDEVPPKPISLALQGGGSHGAFGWGVLDRFLEDKRLQIEGISATSAGSMNAAVVAYGLAIGGRGGARASPREVWVPISQAGRLSSPPNPAPPRPLLAPPTHAPPPAPPV